MTGHLLEQAYGPTHPLYLGSGGTAATPAGAAVMLAATDVLRMTEQGHPLGRATVDARLIARHAEAGGTREGLADLLDAGALHSARTAFQTWRHREGATAPVQTITASVLEQTEQTDEPFDAEQSAEEAEQLEHADPWTEHDDREDLDR